jgi:hypothetical protein
MVQARQAWVQHAGGASYLPRFETTQNWARSVWAERGGFAAAAEDLREDPALDLLNAEQWLVRAGFPPEALLNLIDELGFKIWHFSPSGRLSGAIPQDLLATDKDIQNLLLARQMPQVFL